MTFADPLDSGAPLSPLTGAETTRVGQPQHLFSMPIRETRPRLKKKCSHALPECKIHFISILDVSLSYFSTSPRSFPPARWLSNVSNESIFLFLPAEVLPSLSITETGTTSSVNGEQKLGNRPGRGSRSRRAQRVDAQKGSRAAAEGLSHPPGPRARRDRSLAWR